MSLVITIAVKEEDQEAMLTQMGYTIETIEYKTQSFLKNQVPYLQTYTQTFAYLEDNDTLRELRDPKNREYSEPADPGAAFGMLREEVFKVEYNKVLQFVMMKYATPEVR